MTRGQAIAVFALLYVATFATIVGAFALRHPVRGQQFEMVPVMVAK